MTYIRVSIKSPGDYVVTLSGNKMFNYLIKYCKVVFRIDRVQ